MVKCFCILQFRIVSNILDRQEIKAIERYLRDYELSPFFGIGCVGVIFQQEGKVLDDRQRQKSLPRQKVSTGAKF